jgi:hypothetical protein
MMKAHKHGFQLSDSECTHSKCTDYIQKRVDSDADESEPQNASERKTLLLFVEVKVIRVCSEFLC